MGDDEDEDESSGKLNKKHKDEENINFDEIENNTVESPKNGKGKRISRKSTTTKPSNKVATTKYKKTTKK